MTDLDPSDWFLILYSISVLGIVIFIVRAYTGRYFDLKGKVHAIHVCIELIDAALEDEAVTKAEFIAIVKRCLNTVTEVLK